VSRRLFADALLRLVIPSGVLVRVVSELLNGVRDVCLVSASPMMPRQLLNALWSFERDEAIKNPFVFRGDTQANRNKLRKHTLNILACAGNGESARAAQGILQDLRRRTFITVMTRLLPRILPLSTLRSASTLIMDENKEQQDGAKAARGKGVFHPQLVILLCLFHFLTMKLKDPDHFGTDHVAPGVFKRILATLWSVATYCETRREAMLTLQCLRAYGRRVLQASKFAKLCLFIGHAIALFPMWALFCLRLLLTFGQFTSSSVEGDQSVISRSTRGGFGLDASSELHALVDKGEQSNHVRRIERKLKLNKLQSQQRFGIDGVLQEAARLLQPKACSALEKKLGRAMHLEVEFCLQEGPIGCHWKIRRTPMEPRTHSEDQGVGPSFERVRIVVLCRHEDGHFFLLCSCFWYQKYLHPCECSLAVKHLRVNVFEDVSFVWHLSYANMDAGEMHESKFKPDIHMGKLDGPGVKGVRTADLDRAIAECPADRNGVLAWLKQGGSQWVPLSEPRWRGVSEDAWRREIHSDRAEVSLMDMGSFLFRVCECANFVRSVPSRIVFACTKVF
jgi:hypothetical protein